MAWTAVRELLPYAAAAGAGALALKINGDIQGKIGLVIQSKDDKVKIQQEQLLLDEYSRPEYSCALSNLLSFAPPGNEQLADYFWREMRAYKRPLRPLYHTQGKTQEPIAGLHPTIETLDESRRLISIFGQRVYLNQGEGSKVIQDTD